MKIRTFILCDDIRSEIGGKHSLIGVYKDRIIFPSGMEQKNNWPKAIKIGFYVEVEIDKKLPASFVFKRIESNDESEILKGDINISKDSKIIRMTLLHPAFIFKKSGVMRFIFEFYDKTGKKICTVSPEIDFNIEEMSSEQIKKL